MIVLAVGLHFLPFARAFDTPMFTRLGVVMTVPGGTGLLLGLAWTQQRRPSRPWSPAW